MKRIKRYLFIFVMGMIALPGMSFFAKMARVQRLKSTGESDEKSMSEKRRSSKATLDKSTSKV
jgi:hypothetical protein